MLTERNQQNWILSRESNTQPVFSQKEIDHTSLHILYKDEDIVNFDNWHKLPYNQRLDPMHKSQSLSDTHSKIEVHKVWSCTISSISWT